MLSKWRKDARDGRLTGRAPKALPAGPTREIAKLQQLEREYALLREEARPPTGNDDLAPGTLSSILKQAGLKEPRDCE